MEYDIIVLDEKYTECTICGANEPQERTGKHGTSPEMGGAIIKPVAI